MELNKKKLDIDFVRLWQARGVDPIVLSVLNRRGITTDNQMVDLLSTVEEAHVNPFDFSEIAVAFDRIDKAIANNEHIIIYGDKDVDGTGSVAIITGWLTDLIAKRNSNAAFDWDVPTGTNQYGLSPEKIVTWEGKYNLCITVDCGISNAAEIEQLRNIGIDTIVIDHHEAKDTKPQCVAVVNPMCEDGLNEKKICACVVTYLFIIGYCIRCSRYYNKKIGIMYLLNNKLIYDIYENFRFEQREIYNRLSESEPYKAELNYFFSDKAAYTKEISSFFDKHNIIPITGSGLLPPFMLQYSSDKALNARTALIKTIYNDIPDIKDIKRRYIPIAALGTVADVMPLIGTNRAIVTEGLRLMKTGRFRNIADMVHRADNDLTTLTSKDLSWGLCPLLNASGRMGDATITVLFLKDQENAGFYLDAIVANNKERKKKEEEAITIFKKEYDSNPDKYANVGFFYSDQVFRGVMGTVAARMADYIGVPAFVAAKENDVYIGSVRGLPGISFVDFLSGCEDMLLQFGGHHDAAGFTFSEEKLPELERYIMSHGADLRPITKHEVIDIDAEIPLSYLTFDLFSRLSVLEPFGQSNEPPVLFTHGIEISGYIVMGKNNSHVKITFKTEKDPFVGIWWHKADDMKYIHKPGNRYDVVYTIEKNVFHNVVSLQMNIIDMVVCK